MMTTLHWMDVSWMVCFLSICVKAWLEAYLLTGRHGFFASYEAFIRVVDSMCSTACKMVESIQPAFLETANCILELHFDIECMAAGS